MTKEGGKAGRWCGVGSVRIVVGTTGPKFCRPSSQRSGTAAQTQSAHVDYSTERSHQHDFHCHRPMSTPAEPQQAEFLRRLKPVYVDGVKGVWAAGRAQKERNRTTREGSASAHAWSYLEPPACGLNLRCAGMPSPMLSPLSGTRALS